MSRSRGYRARNAYQQPDVVENYDVQRFDGTLGKLRHDTERRLLCWALGQTKLQSGSAVIDVPCGTGRFLPELKSMGFDARGYDISRAMLDQADKRLRGLDLEVGLCEADATSLPLGEESVDAVVSFRFMNHLPPEVRHAVLCEFARVSKRWLIASFTYRYSLQRLLRHPRRSRTQDHQYPVSIGELVRVLDSSGWRMRAHRFMRRGISETLVCLAERRDS